MKLKKLKKVINRFQKIELRIDTNTIPDNNMKQEIIYRRERDMKYHPKCYDDWEVVDVSVENLFFGILCPKIIVIIRSGK